MPADKLTKNRDAGNFVDPSGVGADFCPRGCLDARDEGHRRGAEKGGVTRFRRRHLAHQRSARVALRNDSGLLELDLTSKYSEVFSPAGIFLGIN